MKVIHVIDSLKIGGVEVGMLNLLAHDSGYKVLAVNGCDEVFFNQIPEYLRKNIIILNSMSSALKFLSKEKPDIIVSSLWRAHIVSLLSKMFIKKLHRVHFVHSARFAHIFDKVTTLTSVKFAQSVIYDSQGSKTWLDDRVSKKAEQRVIPMNISFSNEVRYFDVNNLKMSFVYTGRISPVKKLNLAIDYIFLLKERGYQATLDIFGPDSGSLEYIKEYISIKGLNDRVRILDSLFPLEIEKKMREYNFYLQTSEAEGMAISVFQSLLNGLIPIVTPVGDIGNYTIDNYNSLYIDSNDLLSSVDKFISAYENKFEGFNVGYVDRSNYPEFSSNYFDFINGEKNKV